MNLVYALSNNLMERHTGLLPVLMIFLASCGSDFSGQAVNEVSADNVNVRKVSHSLATDKDEKLIQLRCGTCHAIDSAEKSIIGPHLAGVLGRDAGSLEGFFFSKGMKDYGEVWTGDILDAFLESPATLVPGTYMAFAGLKKPEQRKLIIDFLKSHE